MVDHVELVEASAQYVGGQSSAFSLPQLCRVFPVEALYHIAYNYGLRNYRQGLI